MKDDISYLKGVGEKTLLYFKENNILTITDLFLLEPKRYDCYIVTDLSAELIKQTITAKIDSLIVYRKYRKSIDSIIFQAVTNNQRIKVLIFGNGYLRYKLKKNMEVNLFGIYHSDTKEFYCENIFLDPKDERIDVIYGLKNINDTSVSRFLRIAYDSYPIDFIEKLPVDLVNKYKLLEYNAYIKASHFPMNSMDIKQVMRRKKYSNFFFYSLSLESLKYIKDSHIKLPKEFDFNDIKTFLNELPFMPTDDQLSAINKINFEMKQSFIMNRLIQGDVGSGKTLICIAASLMAYKAHYQTVLLAPTEILAKQHYQTFTNYLTKYGIYIGLLTGKMKTRERAEVIAKVNAGRINILIGTHALLFDNVKYFNLGLAIIDEQHRFGVAQRGKLLASNNNLDALYLTATPIPRTLGLSTFGDLDITSIHTMPSNRKSVITTAINELEMDKLLSAIREQVELGNQVYIIVPLVIENLDYSNWDIKKAYEYFSSNLKDIKISYVHGKMKSDLKDQAMNSFLAKESMVLISTTVIEVGIDCPNATMIVIMNAHMFGLSQLHQLRGRVGRSSKQSYCYLVSNKSDCKRLDVLVNSNDGFEISYQDYLLRGPGDYLGTSQSGFQMMDESSILADQKMFEIAKDDAKDFYFSYKAKLVKSDFLDKLIKTFELENQKIN